MIENTFYDSCGNEHKLSDFQTIDIQRLLKLWIEYGPDGYGEFDFINFISERRGWHPIVPGGRMHISIGSKNYEITRR
mgnify:CR=1 FL=1